MDLKISCRLARRFNCGIPSLSTDTRYSTCNNDCDSQDELSAYLVGVSAAVTQNMDAMESLQFYPTTRSQSQSSMTPVFESMQIHDADLVVTECVRSVPYRRQFQASCHDIINNFTIAEIKIPDLVPFVSTKTALVDISLCSPIESESVR